MKPKKRDQIATLKPIYTGSDGKTVKIKVVMWDSMNGYLGVLPDDEWKWFSPKDWEEI